MVATTMESITSLINTLQNNRGDDLSRLRFEESDGFSWNHGTATITYNPADTHAELYLLHEYAHAELAHATFSRDVELITMERDAWHRTRQLAADYDIPVDDTLVEEALDTYRDWLHARSTCPNCQSTGIQTGDRNYTCLACRHKWRVNEARTCALRRYSSS